MAEYIDRDKLYTEVTEKYHDITAGSYPFNVVAHDMAQLVKNAPTEDVVPVVRCKDCKYWNKTDTDIIVNIDYGKCTNSNSPYHNEEETTGGDYCSYGERRTD